METCTVCGKSDVKNMGAHLNKAHNMTKADLEKETELTNDISDETITQPVSEQNQVKVTRRTNKTMNEKDLKLAALRSDQLIAYDKAEEMAGPENLEIHSLNIAEALVTNFGYKCSEVRSQNPKKGIQKKTWILKKI